MQDVRAGWLVLLTFSAVALVPVRAQGQAEEWEETRSLAESRHEVIMLLIKKQEFESVAGEAEKICRLQFPEERRHLLAEGMGEIIDALVHHEQFDLGQAVLDVCSRYVNSVGLLSEFCQLKAYLFKKTGQDDLAMEYFKKAIELKEQAVQEKK